MRPPAKRRNTAASRASKSSSNSFSPSRTLSTSTTLPRRSSSSSPPFVEYLKYLQYWSKPPYLKYLAYPGPTLRNLELLQQETFRKNIISPDFVHAMVNEGMKAAVDWHQEQKEA